jgi:hypothetical protein
MYPPTATSSRASSLLAALSQNETDAGQECLVHCNIVHMQRMSAKGTRNIWLLVTQLGEHGLEKA